MDGDIIKSFMIGLGFGVDDASLAKFNKAITSATVRISALYGSIQAMAAGIFYGISKMSQGFEDIGYELRLVAPAINKMLILRQAMLDAYRRAGVNLTKVVQQSILFNLSLAKTKFALEAVYKSVGAKFLPLLTKQMDIFRQKIFANMPKIQEQLTKFVNFIFKAFDATVQLGTTLWSVLGRVWDFLKKLDEVTGGWSTKIIGLVAAWKILNLGFIATPLGMILTGMLALLALYDDFKVWQEGGESLIDWGSSMTKTIVMLVAALATVGAVWGLWTAGVSAFAAITAAIEAFNIAMGTADILLAIAEAPFYAVAAAIGAIIWALTKADEKWNIFGGHLSGFFGGIGGWIMDHLGAGGAGQNATNAINPQPLTASTGPNVRVNHETNINVQGSADANATGKAVASEQNKVNADSTRNWRGALKI